MIALKRSPNPVAQGIKEALKVMAQSGYVTTVVADNYGMVNEAHAIADEYNADRFVAYRIVGYKDGFNFDVPGNNYTQSVGVAAQGFATALKKWIPPEHDPRTWIIVWNEIDKNKLGYCSEVALQVADLLPEYKLLFFGLNAGEPEPNQLDDPKFKQLMNRLQLNRDRLGLAIHEYTFNSTQAMSSFTPHLIGRVKEIIDRYPGVTIGVTEFGWGKDGGTVPDLSQMISDIGWAVPYYKSLGKEVRALALWYDVTNDPSWGDIGSKLSPLVPHLAQISASNAPYPWYEEDVPVIPPPAGDVELPFPPETTRIILRPRQLSATQEGYIKSRMRNGYPANFFYPGEEGLASIGVDTWSHQDAINMMALAVQLGKTRSRIAVVYGDEIGTGLDADWVIANHPEYLSYFVFDSQNTGDWKDKAIYSPIKDPIVTQDFLARSEYYGQFGFCGHEGIDFSAPLGVTFHTVARGVVERVSDKRWSSNELSAYGWHVIIDHGGWRTLYAHCKSSPPVAVGQVVEAGQVIAYSGDTGISTGPHLHFSVLLPQATHGSCFPQTKFGYYTNPTVIKDYPNPPHTPPPPPPNHNTGFGLHFNSSPYIRSEEIAEAAVAKVNWLKVLSHQDPNSQGNDNGGLNYLANKFPNAPVVVRAFVSLQGISPTPQQFLDATLSDLERTINVFNKNGREIYIEVHNEPNLNSEGLGRSWTDGKTFTDWVMPIMEKYRQEFNLPLVYPASSPGVSIPNIRMAHRQFEDGARVAIDYADVMACHIYWSAGWPLIGHPDAGITLMDNYLQRFPTKQFLITECSRNDVSTPHIMANEYLTFHNMLKSRSRVKAVTFWLSHGVGFEHEAWLHSDFSSRGIAGIVARR